MKRTGQAFKPTRSLCKRATGDLSWLRSRVRYNPEPQTQPHSPHFQSRLAGQMHSVMNMRYCKAMRGAREHFSGRAKCLEWMSGRFYEKLNLTLNRQVWKDILLGCCPNSLERKKRTPTCSSETQFPFGIRVFQRNMNDVLQRAQSA